MVKRVSYSVASVSLNEWTIKDITQIFLEFPYTENAGYGIMNCNVEENIIIATMLKRSATFISEYNVSSKQLEKKQIFIFEEIQFYLDFNLSLLYTIGQQNNLTQVKLLFRKILNRPFVFKSIEITPYKAFELFTKQKVSFAVEEICVENFNYLNGIVGRFNAKVFDNSIGKKTIKEYKDSCSKILFRLSNTENETFKCQVYSSGSFCLISEEDDVIFNFDYIKKIIL